MTDPSLLIAGPGLNKAGSRLYGFEVYSLQDEDGGTDVPVVREVSPRLVEVKKRNSQSW